MKTRQRRILPKLLTVLLVSRVIFIGLIFWIGGSQSFFSPDTITYLMPAGYLLHGNFSSGHGPELLRTPGYPLILCLTIASGHVVFSAIVVNLILAAVTGWLVWRIALLVSSDIDTATWAVMLYCFEPVGFVYSAKMLSDTLFCALLLSFVWMLLRFLYRPSWNHLLLAGAFLACATYTRPASLFLNLWLVPLLLVFPRAAPMRHRVLQAMAFVVIFAVGVSPWFVRNAVVAGYHGFSSISETSLYFFSAAAIEARVEHKSLSQMQAEFGYGGEEQYIQAHPEQHTWSPAQRAAFQRAAAATIISRHPFSNLLVHSTGCVIVAFGPGTAELVRMLQFQSDSGDILSRFVDVGAVKAIMLLMEEHAAVSIAFALMEAQLIAYYIAGVLGLRCLSSEIKFVFVSFFLYFILVSGGPGAVARYRVPIMPIVCICAGVAVANWRRAGSRSFLQPGLRIDATTGAFFKR